MEIIALGSGTSQGIPIIGCKCKVCCSDDPADKRLRSSVLFKSELCQLLIDIGPDFRQQFLTNQLTSVDHILITHEHNDHIIGLDDIRAINFSQNKSIPIYTSARVGELIKNRFNYIFRSKPYPGAPKIDLHIIEDETFVLDDLRITPINVLHGELPILGFRVNNAAYITDASYISDLELDKLTNLEVLIINALRIETHYSHYNLDQALEVIKKINPKKAFLTHLSHNMGLTAEWQKNLPANVYPLQDRLIIKV